MTEFDFKVQLEVGQSGEADFLNMYPSKLEIHPGFDGDFICKKTGDKIELKTDTYRMSDTPNFFIERYSDFHKKSPGSVWQALEHGCKRFCYYFVKDGVYFEFDNLPKLCNRLEKLIEGRSYIQVKNKAWVTIGYTIKREDLSDLYTEWSIE